MATSNSSPVGFSYAQAARGRSTAGASQSASNKAAPGSTPSGSLPDLNAGASSWADDVEETVGDKGAGSQKAPEETTKPSAPKESAVERAKSEDKAQHSTSGVSSPDLPASASTTTKEDDSSSAPNGSSSETTWETKSQNSEPSWIAERKERQSSSQTSDNTVKGEKKQKKQKESRSPSPVKPVVLHDAPPPSVNPWAKMSKPKAPTPVAPAQPATASTPKENQQPRSEPRKKAAAAVGTPTSPAGDDNKKPSGPANRRGNEARLGSRSTPKQQSEETHVNGPSAGPMKAGGNARQTPVTTSVPPPVKDEALWPTPDSALEKDRKEAPKKAPEDKQDDDTPTTKRKKPEWQPVPVQHSVIWETQSMNEPKGKSRPSGGERGARGGSARGRGGLRGAPNGINGGDRQAARAANTANPEAEAAGRPAAGAREAVQPTCETTGTPLKSNLGSVATEKSTADVKPQADLSRAKSPKKASTAGINETPKPIPQRTAGTQTEEGINAAESTAREGGVAHGPTDSRKDNRNFDNFREPTWGPRGGKRGGRGRGGGGPRDLGNGHAGNHAYAHSFQAEFPNGMPYGGPASPSHHQGRGGNHQYGYNAPGRGGWRATPRSQSIPIDNNYYARYSNFAPGPGQMAPMQPYMPGVIDANGVPMPAMPYSPHVEQQYLLEMVSTQLEYYFSLDNLLKDMFLRKQMDSQGFVFLEVITNFNRMKTLTTDKDVVKHVCMNSESIEIRVGEDGKERLRRRDKWQQFLLPMDQRDAIAQTEGPKHLESPEKPQFSMNNPGQHYRGPNPTSVPFMHQRYDRRSYDSGYPMMNGYAAPFAPYGAMLGAMHGDMPNGDEMRGRSAKSPMNEMGLSPNHFASGSNDQTVIEQDAFPDDRIGMLSVVARTQKSNPPPTPSRTFSNGSIDTKSVELQKPKEGEAGSKPNGEKLTNGDGGSASTSRSASPTNEEPRSAPGASEVFWVKDPQVSTDNLHSSLQPESYIHLRLKALDQRNQASTGTCPYDLTLLYQFWSHFLLRNFNNKMYSEFQYFATADAKDRRNTTGLQQLIKYYSEALSNHTTIRDRVVRDYVALVKNEPSQLDGLAFKDLRAAWRNGALNLKNRKKMADIVDAGLKEQLDKQDT